MQTHQYKLNPPLFFGCSCVKSNQPYLSYSRKHKQEIENSRVHCRKFILLSLSFIHLLRKIFQRSSLVLVSQKGRIMCPLRFILVFFSAVLAGYIAWRTVRSSPEIDKIVSNDSTKATSNDKQELNSKRMVQNGFWVFVDMASGKYLWRNLQEIMKDPKVKSS